MIWIALYLYIVGVLGFFLWSVSEGTGLLRPTFVAITWPVTIPVFAILTAFE